MKITEPGIYIGVSSNDYHDDPSPEPSFSQSIGKVILAQSAAHARAEHPRLALPLGPDEEEGEKYAKAQAIGDACHVMMLGRGKPIAEGCFSAWTTKAAKEFRADALARGANAILSKHLGTAVAMVEVARKTLDEIRQVEDIGTFGRHVETDGDAEVMIAWQEDGLWARSLIDWLERPDTKGGRRIIDYKTTGMSAAPNALDKLMADAGWPIQAAMHEFGMSTIEPQCAGRLRHLFVAQEQYPPYELTVSHLPESTMVMGRKLLTRAWSTWRAAMLAGRWDGYPRRVQAPGYPTWMENRFLEEEVEEDERRRHGRKNIPSDILMAG